ncbi:MAG: hypothetical protein Q9227_007026 [Pyrenula ochraceoflavens]
MATTITEQLSRLQLSPEFPESYPKINPVDVYRLHITERLASITGIEPSLIYSTLQWTQTLEKGDLTLPIPRLQIKGTPPAKLAQQWAQKFPEDDFVLRPMAVGVNISFTFSSKSVASVVLPTIYTLGSAYGFNTAHGERIPGDPSSAQLKVVEFSSPNIAKEFHAGHLRSTIIGGFLSTLYEKNGFKVVRMNYLGDWGRQYGLLAVGWQKYGSEELLQENPASHLFDVYVKISNDFKPEDDAFKAAGKRGEDTSQLETTGLFGQVKKYFKSMEEGDQEALALWKRFRDMSIEKYKTSYSRLNVEFDEYSGESTVKPSTMQEAEEVLKQKGLIEIDQGAEIIDFKKHGSKKLEKAIVRNRNGTTTYLLRDIGAAIERYRQYHFDSMVYVVMAEQDIHLQRFFKILELMGGEYKTISSRCQHVNYGKVMGMSTRRGTVKFLDDILRDVGDRMHELMRQNPEKYSQVEDPEKVADILGISAVMVQDMSGKRINNYPFDLQRMFSFEGDTGPYLQYAHARLCSVSRKTGFGVEELEKADFSLLKEKHAWDLLRLMGQFPDTIGQTLKTQEPTTMLTYLFRLTHQLSSSYDVLRVVGAPEGRETSVARASLYEAFRQVLGNGMRLLGLTPVERFAIPIFMNVLCLFL